MYVGYVCRVCRVWRVCMFYEQLHYPLISPWDEFINFPPTNNFTCTHLLINQLSYPYSLILFLLFLFISSLPNYFPLIYLFPPSPPLHYSIWSPWLLLLPFPSYNFLFLSLLFISEHAAFSHSLWPSLFGSYTHRRLRSYHQHRLHGISRFQQW